MKDLNSFQKYIQANSNELLESLDIENNLKCLEEMRYKITQKVGGLLSKKFIYY